MKFTSILFSFFLLLSLTSQAQQINFAVQHQGEDIGIARVWVEKNQQQDIFAFQVEDAYDLPLEVSSITSMYENGKLLSSSFNTGEGHINVKGDGQFYHIMNGGEYRPVKSDWVNNGMAKLFCQRPEEGQLFLEGEGALSTIHQKGTDSYGLQLANNTELVFTYRFDECVGVTIHQEGKEWKLTRMNPVTL